MASHVRNKVASDAVMPIGDAPLEPSKQEILQELIAKQFERLAKGQTFYVSSFSAFKKRVEKMDYSFGMDGAVSLKGLIEFLMEQGMEVPVLLDLGTGSGSVPCALMKEFKGGLIAYGLDVKPSLVLPEDRQIVGDIENLQELEMLKKMHFDIIVSIGVFDHLIDPAAALRKAYDLLPIGGYLLVDRMVFSGLEGYGPSLISYLRQQGYCMAAECVEATPMCAFTTLIFRKTHDSLELPFHINPLDPIHYGKVLYEAEDALINPILNETPDPFHQQLEMMFSSSKTES